MKKRYKAKLYPLFSIQFYKEYKDRGNANRDVINLSITSNIKDGTDPLGERKDDMFLHGKHLARTDLLTLLDKEALALFCTSYLKNYMTVDELMGFKKGDRVLVKHRFWEQTPIGAGKVYADEDKIKRFKDPKMEWEVTEVLIDGRISIGGWLMDMAWLTKL